MASALRNSMLQNYVVNSRRKTVWLALIFLILMEGGAVLPPAEARYRPTTGTDFFSRDQEIQAGQQAAADVNRKMPVLPGSDPVARYVQRLGGELAAPGPGGKWAF